MLSNTKDPQNVCFVGGFIQVIKHTVKSAAGIAISEVSRRHERNIQSIGTSPFNIYLTICLFVQKLFP